MASQLCIVDPQCIVRYAGRIKTHLFSSCNPPDSQVYTSFSPMRKVTLPASMESICTKRKESEKRWYTNNEKQSSRVVFVRTLDR